MTMTVKGCIKVKQVIFMGIETEGPLLWSRCCKAHSCNLMGSSVPLNPQRLNHSPPPPTLQVFHSPVIQICTCHFLVSRVQALGYDSLMLVMGPRYRVAVTQRVRLRYGPKYFES